MVKIDNIIWSRSRACQLDLLLRSTRDHFKNAGRIFVLWKADNEKFRRGYDRIMGRDYGLDIEFIQERNFQTDIKNILSDMARSEYVLGNSDDNVFIGTFIFDDFNLPSNVVAFSLRMGRSINFSLPANSKLDIPAFIEDGKILKWDWTRSAPNGCWGYPHPVDSNIYRRYYWIELIRDKNFACPKEMEEQMDWNRNTNYPCMESFPETHLVSISANELGQGSNLNNLNMSLEELNDKFLDGYAISTEGIYGMRINSCHILKGYSWEK